MNPLAYNTERRWAERGTGGRVRRVRVDLPSGPAWRVDRLGGETPGSFYFIRGPERLYYLDCSSSDPPADDWQSVAETFEFIDAASGRPVSSPAVLGSGRIVRPAEGFALTLSEDWIAEEVPPGSDALLFPQADAELLALQPTVFLARRVGRDHLCRVDDLTRLAARPPAWHDARTAAIGVAGEGEVELLDLPAGPTGHISSRSSGGRASEAYVFTDGATFIYFTCESMDPPSDAWRSIAETFELLPPRHATSGPASPSG
jgi:hypothetical protein